ncbi:MAG: hypothetical protein BWK76_17920 [Desulfobulbaceae bacterium A2]|nr:MAG: hypothetical protein BWK76_17920 [Desulfobulbaceae bacterium A2]
MIYPKGVLDFLCSDPELSQRYGDILRENVRINCGSSRASEVQHRALIDYLFGEGFLRDDRVREFCFFLSTMHNIFLNILRYFDKVNKTSTHKDDTSPAGTHPDELMRHACYIYYLNSHGVAGDVIECGTYKGFSACCLSWVCHFLGRRLVVADSFAGLPPNETDQYYKAGDFKGTLDEVTTNIRTFGRLETVSFVQGFFSESLKDYVGDICLLWFDVDLYESTLDIMQNLYGKLSPGGVLLSHELFAERDFRDGRLLPTIGPSLALHDYFAKNGIVYQAKPLTNGSGLIVPGAGTEEQVLWSEDVFQHMLLRAGDPVFHYHVARGMSLEQDNAQLRRQLEETTSCFSFRLGRALTAPYRTLKNSFASKS